MRTPHSHSSSGRGGAALSQRGAAGLAGVARLEGLLLGAYTGHRSTVPHSRSPGEQHPCSSPDSDHWFSFLFLPSLSVGWPDSGVQGQVGSFYHKSPGGQTQAIKLGSWLIYLANPRTTDLKVLAPVIMELGRPCREQWGPQEETGMRFESAVPFRSRKASLLCSGANPITETPVVSDHMPGTMG